MPFRLTFSGPRFLGAIALNHTLFPFSGFSFNIGEGLPSHAQGLLGGPLPHDNLAQHDLDRVELRPSHVPLLKPAEKDQQGQL